jgi:hypothetical protein
MQTHHYVYRTQFTDGYGRAWKMDGHLWSLDGHPLSETDMSAYVLGACSRDLDAPADEMRVTFFNWTRLPDTPADVLDDTDKEAGQ